MSIHLDSVVYTDPTDQHDLLSATPTYNNGVCYGTISVTSGADFGNSSYDNRGTTQVVCVKPGDELTLLAALGDRLRGVRFDEPDNKTVVGTIADLREFANSLRLTEDQTNRLLGLFTTSPVKDGQLV